LALLAAVGNAQQTWFLKESNGKWKSFRNKTEWKQAADQAIPLETAVVSKSSTEIHLRYDIQGESGDWSVINKYRAVPGGQVIALTRTIVSVSQKLQLVLIYARSSSGGLKVIRRSETSLVTGKKSLEELEVPKFPIVENVYTLDFLAPAHSETK
jgi:hypothetical protein